MRNRFSTAAIPVGVAAFLALVAGEGRAARPAHKEFPIKLMNLETGYVLGNGAGVRLGIGDSGFGIMNIIQLSTNTLLDMATLVNGQLKVRLVPETEFLPSISTGAAYYNLASSEYITEAVVEEAFSGEEMDLDSGLDVISWFVSASRRINGRLRAHAGYQLRHVRGDFETKSPVFMESEEDSMGIDADFDESVTQRCLVFGADFDLFDHFKLMFELGRDFTSGRARGGAGARLGIGGSFAIQAGVLWPGAELDEDIDIPVLPHFSMFWRF